MQLHHVAVAFAMAGLLVGCGFVPKQPVQPDTSRRVPVNLAAPNLRPVPSRISAPPAAATPPPPLVAATAPPQAQDAPLSAERAVKPVAMPIPGTSVAAGVPDPGHKPSPAPSPPLQAAESFAATDAAITLPVPMSPTPLEPGPAELVTSSSPAEQSAVTTTARLDSEGTKVDPSAGDASSGAVTANPIPVATAKTWSARQGISLSDLIGDWALQEAWTLQWDSNIDFAIDAPFSLDAPDFLAAADLVFKAYADAGCVFGIAAYSNNVLVVKTPRNCRT